MKGERSNTETGSSNLSMKMKSGRHLIRPRIPAAYFMFMKEFIKVYRKSHSKNKKKLLLTVKASDDGWGALSEEDKKSYEDKAQDRMPLYEKRLKAYSQKRDNAKLHKTLSPFLVFREEQFLKNKAAATIKQLSREWKSMTDIGKAPYVSKADENKIEYERNVVAHYSKEESDESMSEGSQESVEPKPEDKPKPEDVAPAATGFLVFLEEFLRRHVKTPENQFDNVIEDMSRKWKSMEDSNKAPYIVESDKLMVEFERKALAFYMKVMGTDEPECEETDSEETQAATGLLIFMDEFQENYEKDPADDPNAFMEDLSKRWESMTNEGKAPYVDEANEVMREYEKSAIAHYKKELEEAIVMDEGPEMPEVSEESVPAATGLLMFLRKEYVEKNPENKSASALEEMCAKWRSMSDNDKGPYITEADEIMSEYEKSMKHYFKKLAEYEQDMEAYAKKLDKEQ